LSKKPSKKLRITIKYSIDNATFSFKKITKPMMGFKAFHSAQATIAGIEAAHARYK
jgi:transposase-like protein